MASSTVQADLEAQISDVTEPLAANIAVAPPTHTPNPQPPPSADPQLQVTNVNEPPNGNPRVPQTANSSGMFACPFLNL